MVWLPSTLHEIGEKAFENCRAITQYVPTGTKAAYNVTGGWEKFSNVVEGYLVDAPTIDDMTYNRLINGKGNSTSAIAILTKSATTTADVVIPASIKLATDTVSFKVKTISESAFKNNTKLVNLTIPEFVDQCC